MNKQSDSLPFSSLPFQSLSCQKKGPNLTLFFSCPHTPPSQICLKDLSLSLILCVRGRDDKGLSMQLGFRSSFNSMGFLPSLWPQAYFKDVKALGLMTKSNTISVTHETKLDCLFAAPNVCSPLTCEAHPESSYAEIFPCSTFTTQHLLTAY